jgi:thiosulfate/3-mercaptopyruvate sulfurtransferase
MNLIKSMYILIGIGLGLIIITLASTAHAAECADLAKYLPADEKCSSASGDEWDPLSKMDEIGKTKDKSQASLDKNWAKVSRQYRWNQSDLGSNNSRESSTVSTPSETKTVIPANKQNITVPKKIVKQPEIYVEPTRSSSFYSMMAPISNISQYDIILDVSDGVSKFIPGAVHIDYLDFQNNSTLRDAEDIAKILGDSGISRNDKILIYGECKPCGGGPAVSTYVYWIMRYLGHDPSKVQVLDGGIRNFVESNHSLSNESKIRPKTKYVFEKHPDFLATFDEVMNSRTQIVDARSLVEFGSESIPGSINIPYDTILSNGRIKDESKLKVLFSNLRKDKPIVVYTTTGVKASLVWFALEIMGYDAKPYTWQDWLDHKDQKSNMNS